MDRRIHWAWVIFSASFITTFAYSAVRMSYGILMPEMIVTLGITKAQAGVIFSSFFITYTVFAPLIGYLVDRVSARKLFTLFSVILAAGTFLMGKPVSFLQACLFFAIVGVGASAMWAPILSLVQRWFARRRGVILGCLSMSWTIAYALMGLVLPWIVAGYGWRACWSLLAILALALVPIHAIFFRTKPQDLNLKPWGEESLSRSDDSPSGVKPSLGYKALLKIPNLWLLGISYFFTAFTSYVINTFIVTYGTLELGFPYGRSAKLASAIAVTGIAGSILLPMLSDTFGRKRCLFLNNLLLALSIVLIPWAGKDWPALLATVSVFGIFYTSPWPIFAAAAGEFFPRGTTGSVLGFWTIFYGIGLILAPAVGGYLADRTGTFVYPFLLAAATGVLSALLLLWVKKPDSFPESSR